MMNNRKGSTFCRRQTGNDRSIGLRILHSPQYSVKTAQIIITTDKPKTFEDIGRLGGLHVQQKCG